MTTSNTIQFSFHRPESVRGLALDRAIKEESDEHARTAGATRWNPRHHSAISIEDGQRQHTVQIVLVFDDDQASTPLD